MDITEELKELRNNKDFGQNIVDNLQIKHNELEKKIYLFKVITLGNTVEDLIQTDFFKDTKMDFVEISYNNDGRSKFQIHLSFYTQDSFSTIAFCNRNVKKKIKNIENLFNNISSIPIELHGKFGHSKRIKVKEGIKNQIINFFLSDELKQILKCGEKELEYLEMQTDLLENTTTIKKIKI